MEKGNQQATIRRRPAPSFRRRDGLIKYAYDKTSQNGEDGIINQIFTLLPAHQNSQRWCVDVGAWDGKHLSNTYSLLVDDRQKWKGILIEADRQRFQELSQLHSPLGNTCLCCTVESHSFNDLLRQQEELPIDFDFLCIDIDGSDYWVLYNLLHQSEYRPKVICIEFNPTMPNDLVYIPPNDDSIRHGASLAALVELAEQHSYVLIETTLYNAFFIQQELYRRHFTDLVKDTSIEALHEVTMGTTLYQLYDGTIKLTGCRKLLWHRVPIDESKVQILQEQERHFPFAPPPSSSAFDDYWSQTIDMGASNRRKCSRQLAEALQRDGFCYVRGTGISAKTCRDVLDATNSFLQQADESVRRSCLAKDRARRGYSPMCTENFASLIGADGPNDLVRKFRVGPLHHDESNSLLQPNVWPLATDWESATSFRMAVEEYFREAETASKAVVRAICEGLMEQHADLESSLTPLFSGNGQTTSILTLLGYRVGSRHKGKNKGPLVAPHTDVGVITFLLFDQGTCASLQRKRGDEWVDVPLPDVSDDPVFVVNVADCFADLSGGRLQSTLHRVVAKQSSTPTPRNCCAMFVGLDPKQILHFKGECRMTYEEWRKHRISKAQDVLKANKGS